MQCRWLLDRGNPERCFIKGIDTFIRHSLRHYWVRNPQVDLYKIAFHAESLVSILKALTTPRTTVKVTTSRISRLTKDVGIYFNTEYITNTDIITSTLRNPGRRLKLSPVLNVNLPQPQIAVAISSPSSSSTMLLVNACLCELYYDPSHLTTKFTLLAQDYLAQLSKIYFRNRHTLTSERPSSNRDSPNNRFRGLRVRRSGSTVSDQNIRVLQTKEKTAHVHQTMRRGKRNQSAW